MTSGRVSAELCALASVFVLATALAAGSVAGPIPAGAGPDAVDILVLDAADPRPGVPAGEGPRGGVDAAEVTRDNFSFTGWADFAAGASSVLRTDRTSGNRRLRARSLPRPDVAEVLQDEIRLYSGFQFTGEVATFGAPLCLMLQNDAGSKPVWEAAPGSC